VLSRDDIIVNDQSYLYELSQTAFTNLQLVTSSSTLVLQNIKDDTDAVRYIRNVRKFLHDNFEKDGMYVVPSGLVISLYTQYVGVKHYMGVNLGYVSITIIITGIIFLLHPVAVLLVCLCDFAMLLEVYGFSDWVGLRINGVMALNIIIAVGLSMEFTAHMARAYMLAMALPGEKVGLPGATEAQIRLKKAYREMFTPVTLGAITTILGVAPISAATFPYFRQYYFVLYVFIVMFGWVNGVIFLPIMLSLMNPHPWGQDLERRALSQRGTLMQRQRLTEAEGAAHVVSDATSGGTTDAGEH
jgi:predicted RND superfamily exporter protein